jgi:hypothetical protein
MGMNSSPATRERLSFRRCAIIAMSATVPLVAWAGDRCDDACKMNLIFAKMVRGETAGVREELEAIAARGHVPSQILLAEYFIVSENDLAKGRAILTPLADRGDAKAQLHLAQSYLGRGSPQSDAEGVRWLRAAADANEPTAIGMYVHALKNGAWGIPRNPAEAARYESLMPDRAR